MRHFICPVCLYCGSLSVQENYFCEDCSNHFLSKHIFSQIRILNYKNKIYEVQFLIRWWPYQSDSLSELVYLLKSRWSRLAWIYYAQKLNLAAIASSQTIIVPVPSGQKNRKAYHTQYFSEALAQKTQATICDCLNLMMPSQAQKHADRDGRSEIRAEIREEFTGFFQEKSQIILVDDIITTGSTLKACLEALRPHLKASCQVKIIALFSREKI